MKYPVKLKLKRQFKDDFHQLCYELLVAKGQHWFKARKTIIRRFKSKAKKGII